MPVQGPTRDQPFYTVIPTHRPQLVAFYDEMGIGRRILDNPRALTGMYVFRNFTLRNLSEKGGSGGPPPGKVGKIRIESCFS